MTGAACIFIAIAVAWIAVLYADLRKTVDRLDAESWRRKHHELQGELMLAKAQKLTAERQYQQLLTSLANAKPIKPFDHIPDTRKMKPFTGRKKR